DGHRPIRDECDLLLRGEPGRLQHSADPLRGGRHDRKPVSPALLEAELDRIADILDLIPLRCESDRHLRLPRPGLAGTPISRRTAVGGAPTPRRPAARTSWPRSIAPR